MRAMILKKPGTALEFTEVQTPIPGSQQVRIKVEACAVCRTDVHLMDGDLPNPVLPVIPGHEVVGLVDMIGPDVEGLVVGQRVGAAWLAKTCGKCAFCVSGHENLCDHPEFTGYTRNGGFADFMIAEAPFIFHLPNVTRPTVVAPLMCAGLIGWRSLKAAGDAQTVGIYGFGAAAHLVTQVCVRQSRAVYAFTRPGDDEAQDFARKLGAFWAGSSDECPPTRLDAAIIFAPAGELVPIALTRIRKGGRVVCGGIHMTDIPSFPYSMIWGERQILSVANLTRNDGSEFLALACSAPLDVHTTVYALEQANAALAEVRAGRMVGAAVLVP